MTDDPELTLELDADEPEPEAEVEEPETKVVLSGPGRYLHSRCGVVSRSTATVDGQVYCMHETRRFPAGEFEAL